MAGQLHFIKKNFKIMKKIVRHLFRKFGYDIVKIQLNAKNLALKTKEVFLCNTVVKMPANNPLVNVYKNVPEFNFLIGKIAKIVANKYPELKVIDIGANVGDTTIIITHHINCDVIAIEGDDISFNYLKLNTAINPRVVAYKQFLGDKNQTLQMEISKQGWNNTLLPSNNAKKNIILKTLDTFIEYQKISILNVKLIKLDTEGFDTIILRGATKVIIEQKPVIFLEYNNDNMAAISENGLATILNFVDLGYHDIYFFDPYGNLILKTNLNQKLIIEQLDNYIKPNKNSSIVYYDICLIHKDDGDISEAIDSLLVNA